MRVWIHSLSMKIRPHPIIIIIWRKNQSLHFVALNWVKKQLLQAPNADAVILDGCCSCASSRIDKIRYYQLLASSWSNKRLYRHCVWFILRKLTQLQNAERVNSVWDVYIEHSLKDNKNYLLQVSFSPGNKDSGYHSSSCFSSMPSPSLIHHVTWFTKVSQLLCWTFVLTTKWTLSFSQQIMQWSHIYLAIQICFSVAVLASTSIFDMV